MLAAVHTRGGTSKACVAAGSDFHKNQCVAVSHDQIYFPVPAGKVARQRRKSGRNQALQRLVFAIRTRALRGRLSNRNV